MTDARIAVVTISVDELDARIEAAVRRALETQPAAAPAEWIDTAAAAKLLGMHPRSVTRHAKNGVLPCVRVGGLLRFERAAIDKWLRRAG